MEFTREPIVETVITPREGWSLVVRSSKSLAQEEYFVEALEVVSFGGGAYFFRSKERPKAFIVPIGDYEVIEVREARLVLKTPPREEQVKNERREVYTKPYNEVRNDVRRDVQEAELEPAVSPEPRLQKPQNQKIQTQKPQEATSRQERRRDRRRGFRRRRHRDDVTVEETENSEELAPTFTENNEVERTLSESASMSAAAIVAPVTSLRSVLPPPTTLIKDDLQRLRESDVYRGAFFIREEASKDYDDDEQQLESCGVTEDSIHDITQCFHDDEQGNLEPKESSSEESFLSHQTVENGDVPESPYVVP